MTGNRLGVLLVALLAIPAAAGAASDSSGIRKHFADPPAEYSTAPLWVWNEMLTDAMVTGTLRDLASEKVRQAR